jgi:hypothetical protein
MTIFRLYISILILATFISCSKADKTLDSAKFYSDFKTDFLNSDLTKYNYNPRGHFTPLDFDYVVSYRVFIFRDSSLKIMGTPSFSKAFNIKIDNFFKSDVILSKLSDSTFILSSPFKEEPLTYIIPKQKSSTNAVDYFLNLERLLRKFRILEIASHPSVNTRKIVFSSNDYLIYMPDSLVFKNTENKEFIKHLFKNGKQLDKNWFQFNDTISTDYQ